MRDLLFEGIDSGKRIAVSDMTIEFIQRLLTVPGACINLDDASRQRLEIELVARRIAE